MNILLDMDGVLVDFVGGACQLFGLSAADMEADWKKNHAGEYDCVPRFRDALKAQGKMKLTPGWGPDEFWKHVHEVGGPAFWKNLKPYPWALDLWRTARDLSEGNAWVATAPTRSDLCALGKIQWLREHLDIGPNRFMIGASKELMAKPGTALVDDKEKTCKAFMEGGGFGILFPRVWNGLHEKATNAFPLAAAGMGAAKLHIDGLAK